jgi:hypothetical protein
LPHQHLLTLSVASILSHHLSSILSPLITLRIYKI